jgi:hypothetical protein
MAEKGKKKYNKHINPFALRPGEKIPILPLIFVHN